MRQAARFDKQQVQAASSKQQATSNKQQATSSKSREQQQAATIRASWGMAAHSTRRRLA
jgi:hypothetical protein